MAWIHGDEAVQQLSENIILYDLAQMRGDHALLSRIPQNASGIYAWYRRFELEPSAMDEPEIFVNSILNELSKAHCVTREARLPPAHRIKLQPETTFYKEEILKELAIDPSFRELLFMLLNNSLIFQQPLYIGKATNLYRKIRSHLDDSSILRERLETAGHKISRCRLLLILTPNSASNVMQEFSNNEEDEKLGIQFDECEFSESTSEILLEDILSRLFLPSFTLRYG